MGLLLKNRTSDNFKQVVFTSTGIITLVLGIQMATTSANSLSMILALVIGGSLGSLLKIEDRIFSLGEKLAPKNNSKEGSNFAHGFLTASILFCSGAMTIVGSIQAGLSQDYQTLLIKSIMDCCMAVVLASAYGQGVAFSAVFILFYQGVFTLGGQFIQRILGDAGINELCATGGALLLMIGFNLLDLKKIKTANFLPAIFLSPLFFFLIQKIPFLN